MEGYHWASVGSPNETPIVTFLIYPIGVLPPSPPRYPSPPHGRLVVWSPLLCSLITPFVKAWEVGGRGGVGWLQRRACVPG